MNLNNLKINIKKIKKSILYFLLSFGYWVIPVVAFFIFHDYLILIISLITLLFRLRKEVKQFTTIINLITKKKLKSGVYFLHKILGKLFIQPLKTLIKFPFKIILLPLNLFKTTVKSLLRIREKSAQGGEAKAEEPKNKEKDEVIQDERMEEPIFEEKVEENNHARDEKYKVGSSASFNQIKKQTIGQTEKEAEKNRFRKRFFPKNALKIDSEFKWSKKIIRAFKAVFLNPRLSRNMALVLIFLILFGTFSAFIPRQYNEYIPPLFDEQIDAEEGEILGEKIAIEIKAPLTVKEIIGRGFAIAALFFGCIFFIYSLKYYFSSIIVLLASQALNGGKPSKFGKLFYRLFFWGNSKNGILNNGNGSIGVLPNLTNDHKNGDNKWQPFVSIHLAFYNEKRVANRILTACTSFDYPNYEIIVADDSSDETVQILDKWKKHPRVKIIHRDDRTGYKGMALQEAIHQMDPRTEFVVVFDADFIPYPDTLKQFLKYFQFSDGNGNGNGNGNGIKSYKDTNVAAVQGYQWHVLNKNENWITRGIRSEFAGSYVVERPGREIMGGMKQIAGSVYMIRADVLKSYGWTDSLTEDFELTMRIHRDGWKVIFTPYIQAPAECVSTIRRLIRQRMRWAEGHTRNVRRYFWDLLKSPYMNRREKAEFLYLAPYYLQSAFFLIGTTCWFISDIVLHTNLPFWTALWGWSLVFANLIALPFLNSIGLFFEESPEKDYLGIFSFVSFTYIVAPFQALAAIKGLFKKKPGTWFRTPKSGHITDLYFRSRYRRWLNVLFPRKGRGKKREPIKSPYLKLTTSNNKFGQFKVKKRKHGRVISNLFSLLLILLTVFLNIFSSSVPRLGKEISGLEANIELKYIIGASDLDNVFETDIANKLSEANVIIPTAPTQGQIISLKKNENEGKTKEVAKLPTTTSIPSEPGQFNPPVPNNNVSKTENILPIPIQEAINAANNNFPAGQNEVELKSIRTEKSKYFLNKSGELSQEIGLLPLHYQDEQCEWQDIKTEIKPLSDFQVNAESVYQYANTTNTFKIYFKKGELNDNYLKFEKDGKSISFSLNPEISGNSSPVVKDNQITYPEILPGIDLRYTIGAKGLLEEYLVKNPEALKNIDKLSKMFELQGLYLEEKNDGSIQFYNEETKNKTWLIPIPVMYELNNQGQSNYGLHYKLVKNNESYQIQKIVDQKGRDWLSDPQRQYPLVIDDTIELDYTDITSSDDGYVKLNGSTYSRDTSSNTFGIGYTNPNKMRSFIQFTTTDIPEDIAINYVTLTVSTQNTYGSTDTADVVELDNKISDYATDQALYDDICDVSNTVYYNNYNLFRYSGTHSLPLSSSAATKLQNNVDANPNAPFYVGICGSDETTDDFYLYSSEYANETNSPRLKITYDIIPETVKTLNSWQRQTFYDTTHSILWAFVGPSTGPFSYYSSDDGVTWTKSGTAITGSHDMSLWWDQVGGKVYLTYKNGYDINVKVGSVGSTSISWGTERIALDGSSSTDAFTYPYISRDSSGYCWVGANYKGASNHSYRVVKSDDTSCDTANWSNKDSETDLSGDYGAQIHGQILPLDTQNMYGLWFLFSTSGIEGKKWTNSSSSWSSSADSIGTGRGTYGQPSAVVDNNYNIHIDYVDSNYDINYNKRDPSSGWGTSYVIYGSSENFTGASISLDTITGDIYAIFKQYIYGTANIYYKKGISDWSDINDWTPNTTDSATVLCTSACTGIGYITSNYSGSGRVFAIWKIDYIKFKYILIPEAIWFLIPIIAFLPKQIQKLVKGRKNKKRKFSKLFSIFGFNKKK